MLESLFNKVEDLGLQFYQKETSAQLFSCEYCKILRIPASKNICKWPLLPIQKTLYYLCPCTVLAYLNCRKIIIEETIKNFMQKKPPEVFCKKGVLKNLSKFTGKHLCQSLFFNKVAGAACIETVAQVFPVNFAKFLKSTFFKGHLRDTVSVHKCMKKSPVIYANLFVFISQIDKNLILLIFDTPRKYTLELVLGSGYKHCNVIPKHFGQLGTCISLFKTAGELMGCAQSRGLGARATRLPMFILLGGFSDT